MNKISPPTLWLSLTAIGLLSGPMSMISEEAVSYDKAKKAELRELATTYFGVLPDAMPGSENDNDHRRHLGEKLYFDTLLSKNNTQSCNSCHRVDQGLGGVDNAPGSTGAFGGVGDRNAPTVLNAGFQLAQFWDGRAADLQAQAKGPVLNPGEMAMPSEEAVLDRLRMDDTYRALFVKAFPEAETALTYDNMAEAIAAFERGRATNPGYGVDDDAQSKRPAHRYCAARLQSPPKRCASASANRAARFDNPADSMSRAARAMRALNTVVSVSGNARLSALSLKSSPHATVKIHSSAWGRTSASSNLCCAERSRSPSYQYP